MAPTIRTGDSAEHPRGESLSPLQIQQYAAMLAPYVGISFYVSDEEKERRGEPADGEEKDEEYYYRMFAPSSPEAGQLGSDVGDYFSADEEMPPPPGNANGSGAAAVLIRQEEDSGEFITIDDASYEADNECDCGQARCAMRKKTRTAAAAAAMAREDNSKAWMVVARLAAVAEHGWQLVGYALRTAAARFTAGRTPPYLDAAAQQLLMIY